METPTLLTRSQTVGITPQLPGAFPIPDLSARPLSGRPPTPIPNPAQLSFDQGSIVSDPSDFLYANPFSRFPEPPSPRVPPILRGIPRPRFRGPRKDWSFEMLAAWLERMMRSAEQLAPTLGREFQYPSVFRDDAEFVAIVEEFFMIVRAEVLQKLRRLDEMAPAPFQEVEYENVGADHDVDVLGTLVSGQELAELQYKLFLPETVPANSQVDGKETDDGRDRDQSVRCAICLTEYSEEDPAFKITTCSHILGRSCLESCINSTASASNACPICRACLVPRRPRRPVPISTLLFVQINILFDNLEEVFLSIGEVLKIIDQVWGPDVSDHRFQEFMRVNEDLRQRRIGYQVHVSAVPRGFENGEDKCEINFYRVQWYDDGSLSEASEGYEEVLAMLRERDERGTLLG
ncbi:hypothetical protein BDV96DRAFT_654774 [Lophiotrema nucula]|uniref:RING-type domain-containing protein n=1 Tax=Lophiotrema nucula TaxID=690887 RepID=A0A6A5YJR8_9PLEO|nr:hypothetical protein BDV96DRAFT_654774 [Lophiotrema nucula]